MKLDFRLIDLKYELNLIEESIHEIDAAIERAKAEEEENFKRITKELGEYDDIEWELNRQEFVEKVEFLIPRTFRNPAVVSIYSILEVGLTEIADEIQKKKGIDINIRDLRERSIINSSKLYFNIVLKFDLNPTGKTWEALKNLESIRNAIAHTNGRIGMLRDGQRKKIINLEKNLSGLEIHHGFIIVDKELLNSFYYTVKTLLDDLIKNYIEFRDNQATDSRMHPLIELCDNTFKTIKSIFNL